jgi:hypothetical protein
VPIHDIFLFEPYFSHKTLVALIIQIFTPTLLTFYVEKQEKSLKILNYYPFSLSKVRNSLIQDSVKAGAERSLYWLIRFDLCQ